MNEAQRSHRRAVMSFWLLGLLNNSSFVIMIAAAETISSGGVALVYLASIGPGLCLKTSAPYWFDHVSYRTRVLVAALCMTIAFGLVGITETLGLQLLGVAMVSAQCSIGEASMLALASRYTPAVSSEPDSDGDLLVQRNLNERKSDHDGSRISGRDKNSDSEVPQPGAATLTAWSSGTGFAGVFGYGWVTVLHVWIGMSFCATILLAWSLVVAWLGVFFFLLPAPPPLSGTSVTSTNTKQGDASEDVTVESPLSPALASPNSGVDASGNKSSVHSGINRREGPYTLTSARDDRAAENLVDDSDVYDDEAVPVELEMGFKQRLAFVASLWPFTVPLTVVYFAEYAMQSGVWSGIGFPPDSSSAREEFYEYANWSYQLGVFVSRSSGMLFQPSLGVLWVLPVLQTLLLGFFWIDAMAEIWYGQSLLMLCVIAGLAGGAIYVHGFKLLSASQPSHTRELACAAASVAADFGILIGSVAGLFIQACIYARQDIDGASASGGFCE